MDVEKTISFILDTQAKTEAILQTIAERHNEAEARMDRFDRRMRFYVRTGARQITEIREVQKRTDVVLEQVTRRLDKLGRHLDEVTDKLDGLISIVDGVIRRPQPPPDPA